MDDSRVSWRAYRGARSVAFSIRVSPGTGLALITCQGALQADDAHQAALGLWQIPDWPGEAAVWDFRQASFDLSGMDIREVAHFILRHQRAEPPRKMAFVTPSDVDFGMARMFEVYRADPRTEFHVFRDFDAALAWSSSG